MFGIPIPSDWTGGLHIVVSLPQSVNGRFGVVMFFS